MIIDAKTKYYEGKARIIKNKYFNNDRIALIAFHPDVIDFANSSPIAFLTVNLPEYELEPNQVIIKNWSENKGWLETLINADIVKDTGIKIPTGYVEANVCELINRFSMDEKKYLIWNLERGMWWKPLEHGYTSNIKKAGLYCESDAIRITRDANRINDEDLMYPANQFLTE